MTKAEFEKIVRGDVLQWTGEGKNGIGLVRHATPGRGDVLWEDGLDGM